MLDVAHNPAAATTLAANLRAHAVPGRTLAVCGMLDDKDVRGVHVALRESRRPAGSPRRPRARARLDAAARARARDVGVEMRRRARCPRRCAAPRRARAGDRIVVFGSFHAVGPALRPARPYNFARWKNP